MDQLQKPRGTKDILPAEQAAWSFFRSTAERVLNGLSFGKINTPLFEDKRIFERGAGESSDIIEKQLYLIKANKNEENDELALRPEGTAGAARAYIENGMSSQPQPVRLYYFGTMYRYERPQAGRYREHNQLGVEIFGDDSAESDYLAIMSALEILKKLGFSDFNVAVNSIGCPECRPKYLKKLKDYYADKLSKVCPDCKRRYDINPLRMLDCKNEECQKFKTQAPQMVDSLCTECREHFQDTLQYLDDFGIKFDLDNTLVRGLDYYTRTVFEISAGNDKERHSTLCGGGRYDNLVSILGGPKTPAVGWGMGADRVVDLLKDNSLKIPKPRGVEVVILEIGDAAKKVCRQLFNSLDKEDINVFYIPSKLSLRSQMKSASKLGADFALIVGQQEALTGSVIVRDLRSSTQEDLSISSAIDMIKEKYSATSE
ncbi:MAG: histidine--tRNA ligase [Candidatus Berkelbacteria bacterium]|nr:histidine--tRNA ligase [Candidatus Berkelbacteria bacterium]